MIIALNDLLEKSEIDPARVIVLRHRPTERALRKALMWLAAERHEVYNHYQQLHGVKVEASLTRASHVVSCIGHMAGQAVFVGVYRMDGWDEMPSHKWATLKNSQMLTDLGDRGPKAGRTLRFFRLKATKDLADWKGKLVINWPPPERSWWRRAHRNVMTVHAVHEESLLVRAMPHWTELALNWSELQTLPKSWQADLAQWRGIYHILDQHDGKSYVGSAYGKHNILGRWREYSATGHGGNVELRGRDPANFQFSILERVSPDLPAEDVYRLEASWKKRLGTRECGLNKN